MLLTYNLKDAAGADRFGDIPTEFDSEDTDFNEIPVTVIATSTPIYRMRVTIAPREDDVMMKMTHTMMLLPMPIVILLLVT